MDSVPRSLPFCRVEDYHTPRPVRGARPAEELARPSCWGGEAFAPPLCHGACQRRPSARPSTALGCGSGKYCGRVFNWITPTLPYSSFPPFRASPRLCQPFPPAAVEQEGCPWLYPGPIPYDLLRPIMAFGALCYRFRASCTVAAALCAPRSTKSTQQDGDMDEQDRRRVNRYP